MKVSMIAAAIAALCMAGGTAMAQTMKGPVNDKPLSENWAPSQWGADDKAGGANHTKNPANVKRALATVKQFKSVTIGKFYQKEIPAFGPRVWNLVIPGTPTGGPFGKNALIYHDEFITTEIGQIGTQFDGPGHIGVNTSKGLFMYNGRMAFDSYERGAGGRVLGMGPLGVEHVAEFGFVCRMVILDAAAYKGMERLPIPKKLGDVGVITEADVKGILKKQGTAEPQAGDCVFLHTGHGNSWGNGVYAKMTTEQRAAARAEAASGEPGFGISACKYLISRNIALMGGDTSANDAQPFGEEDGYAVPCHTEVQTRHGIWNIENLDLEALVSQKVYEGAFVWAPLRIVGGTGSPANPVVLY